MPLQVVLAKLETNGIGFRHEELNKLEETLKKRVESIKAQVVQILSSIPGADPANFNLASPEQVSKMLFDTLHLKPPDSTSRKGKHLSTSEETLKGLIQHHPIVQLILDFRGLNKTLTTFVEGIRTFVKRRRDEPGSLHAGEQSAGWKIHAEWNNTTVRTGRMSCCKPNLQQVPKASVVNGISCNIRSFFVPR